MSRFMSVIVILILATSLSGFALAQELPPVPCGDLSEADCAFLNDAQAAALELTAASVTFSGDMSITDLPDTPMDFAFGFSGDGAFSGDLSEYSATFMDNMGDPAAIMDVMPDVFRAFNGSLNLTLDIPAELTAEMGPGMPSTFTIGLLLVDGIGYVNLDDFAEMGAPAGWNGLDIAGALEQAIDSGLLDTSMMGAQADMMDGMMMDPEMFSQYMVAERLPDATAADGTAVAVFSFDFDLAGMMSDPAMRDALMEIMAAQGGMEDMEDMGVDEDMMMDMIAQMYEGFEVSVTQTYGLEDMHARGFVMNMSWDMGSMMDAFAGMAEGMGEDYGEMPEFAPIFTFNMSADITDINGDISIEVPADATVTPLEALFGSMTPQS